jgi:hypothetical protein
MKAERNKRQRGATERVLHEGKKPGFSVFSTDSFSRLKRSGNNDLPMLIELTGFMN